jgi:hypothetical protein
MVVKVRIIILFVGFSGLIFYSIFIFISQFTGDQAVSSAMQQIGAARGSANIWYGKRKGKGLISLKLS